MTGRMEKKKLQVFINDEWQWVFCRNPLIASPVTTKDRKKAVSSVGLEYFKKHYGNFEFRIN